VCGLNGETGDIYFADAAQGGARGQLAHQVVEAASPQKASAAPIVCVSVGEGCLRCSFCDGAASILPLSNEQNSVGFLDRARGIEQVLCA